MTFSRIRPVILTSLTLLFGLQLFRVFMPSVIAYLSRSTNAVGQAIFALAVFLTVLLAPFVRKMLGERGAFVLTMGGIALVRLAVQFVDAPPLYLALSTLGLIFFGWFIPSWQASPRNRSSQNALPVFVAAFPLAFIVDVLTRTLLQTYDFAWRQDPFSFFTVGMLVAFALVLLWKELKESKESKEPGETIDEPAFNQAITFVALGAFLYLALVVINSPAVFIALTGRESLANEFVVSCVIVSALVGVMATNWILGRRWIASLGVGVVLVGSLALMLARAPLGEIWFGLASIAAWICLSWLLASTTRTAPLQPGLWRTSLATFFALIIMLVNVFVVGQYQLNAVNVIAGILLAIATVWATRREQVRPSTQTQVQFSTLVVIVGVVAWLAFWITSVLQSAPPATPPATAQPLRVMTYNIHQGISADGAVSLDEIGAVIALQKLDVVVLNEVNRARPNYGLIDTLPFIGSRAQMALIFGATYDDGQYGNAILSRYPVVESKNMRYAARSNETRALLRAVIQTPSGNVTIYATHLDNINGEKSVRASQVAEILALWNKTPRSILMGDLNAEPNKPELQAIYQTEFVDALAVSGNADAYTFWDAVPTPGRRIDYIFVTPDLKVNKTLTLPTRASDHLPVMAEISLQ